MNWPTPAPNWDTLAGRVLDTFFAAVRANLPDYDLPLTLFGSAPIQLCLDENFTSADVDIMVIDGGETLRKIAADAGIGRAGTLRPTYGVQICPPMLFGPTPHYLQRAQIETRYGLKIVIPHLRDILIGKLHRTRHEGQQGIAPKDQRAFQKVRELCHGHPTKEEFIEDLVHCEPSFRLTSDGSLNAFRFNAEDVLASIYGHKFDLQCDILSAAALASRPPFDDEKGVVAKLVLELNPNEA